MSESDANRDLADTARMNVEALRHDPLENTQRMDVADRRKRAHEGWRAKFPRDPDTRERRKPSTVGMRAPQPDGSVDNARQAVVDFINEGSKHV